MKKSIMLTSILGIALSGCGKEKVTLNTVSMFGSQDESQQYYNELIQQFSEKYPECEVNDNSNTANETWKLRVLSDFETGDEPDVLFYFTGADAQPIIDSAKVVSIEEIRQEYPDYGKNISQTAMEFMIAPDGNTYALPVIGFWEGMYVNKDLFEQYNLELPTDWDKFEKAINTFNNTGILPVAVSFSDVPHYWIEHLILSVAGAEGHEETLSPQKQVPSSWCKGLNLLETLSEQGAFGPNALDTTNEESVQLFKDKKAAMLLDGSWVLGEIEDKDNTTIVPFPSYENTDSSYDIIGGFSSGFYITRKAWDDPEKRELAVNFVNEMTSDEAINEFAKLGGIPATENRQYTRLTQLELDAIKYVNNADNINMPIDSKLTKECWTYIVSKAGNIANGTMTAEEVLTKAAKLNNY